MPILSPLRPCLRDLRMAAVALMAASGAVLDAQSSAADGFSPNPNGVVNVIVTQPDGRILVGGFFTQLQPGAGIVAQNAYLARVNHDGSVDPSVYPQLNGAVNAIALQPNGQFIAGGAFTTAAGGAVSRNRLVRLNADGSLDNTFNPNANGAVYAVAVQANGQIVIGGAFTSLQPNGAASPTTRRHIARLNADGSLDMTYDPEASAAVLALTLLPKGQVLAGGGFATFQPNGAASPSTYNCIARINSDGSLDSTFNPDANGAVNSIVLQTNGQILIAGGFTSVTPIQESGNTTQVDFFARLNADGSLDHSFIINPLGFVSAIALQSDGRMLIGGSFTAVYPVNATGQSATNFIARINTDGSLDKSFNPNPNQAVNAIAVQSDGEIVFGGFFSQLQPGTATAGTPRSCLARGGQDGSLDATLAPDTLGHVVAAAVQSDGKIVIGGTFTSVGGVTRNFLARLNSNGSLDSAFNPTVDNSVSAIAIQSDGKIVIGGFFANVDGIPRSYIARLNPDGTVDGPYNPNANGVVNTLVIQSSGQILAGGGFTLFQPNGASTSTTRSYLARINQDGTLDAFDPEANGRVFAIAIQPNGQIIVGGSFTDLTPPGSVEVNGRQNIARLNNDGTLDKNSFNPNANGTVYAIAVQSDGKVVIGGNFTTLEPATANVNTTATTPTTRNSIARLNSDGTLDTTYDPNANGSVLALSLLSTGQVIAGGNFSSFTPNGGNSVALRSHLARINTDATIDPAFTTSTDAQVSLILPLSNGQMLVAGAFTSIQPNGGAPVGANHLAILNSDGSINGAFSVGSSGGGSGQVTAAAIQPNGALLIGGSFSNVAGATSTNLARFNGDGTTDTAFKPNADGAVNSIIVLPNGAATPSPTGFGAWLNSNGTLRHALSSTSNGQISAQLQLPNGQILVGGLFANLQNVGVANLARLNADGSVDPTFNPSPNGQVRAIVLQSNGQIVISGDFTLIGNTTMNYVARINSDGSLDSAYNPNANAEVAALALQSDGKIVIGGSFSSLQPDGATTATTRQDIARLNTDGTLDTGFNPNANGAIQAMSVLGSGQILVGGSFTNFQPNGTNSTTRQYVARLNSDGTVDGNFNPNLDGLVNAMVVQPNGQAVIGGTFTSLQPNGAGNPLVGVYLIRLNTDGTLDSSFSPTPNGPVSALALAPSGQILAGGSFTGFSPNASSGTPAGSTTTGAYAPATGGTAAISLNYLARINANGTLDTSFDPEPNGPVTDVGILSDGSVLTGGSFTSVQAGGAFLVAGAFVNIGGATSPYIARLNLDGSADTTFTAVTNGPVNALSLQPDGRVIVAGAFTSIGGQFRFNLARLNADGSLDAGFNPGANAAVNTAAVAANGMIVAGGAFTTMGGQPANYLARLSASGAVDASFVAAPNGAVSTVVIQPNGQIVIGGAFTSVSGVARNYLARLNADGSVDTSFNPGPNGPVAAVTLQTDGSLMVGGSFTSIAGQVVSYVARLSPAGSLLAAFSPGANGPVDAIAVQADAKVVIGGSFTAVGGLPRFQFARISAPTQATQSLTVSPDVSTLTWTLGGGSPELVSAAFEESTDAITWTPVGQATRVGTSSSWQLAGIAPTGSANFYARARGVAATAQFSSSSLIETVQAFFVAPLSVVTSGAQLNAAAGTPFTYQIAATNSPTSYGASGLPAGLSVNAATGLISGTPTQTGTFTVTLTVSNGGSVSTGTLFINVSGAGGTGFTAAPNSLSSRLINVSTRAILGGGQSQILGFVITGAGSKSVLLRAVGPGLAPFGISNPVATPQLQLFSTSGALLAQNAGWGGSSALSAAFAQVGAFGLAANSADAAVLTTLAPGPYTIKVSDLAGVGGTVLSEVYDAAPSPLAATQRLANLSSRGTASSGSGTLVAGFVIAGNSVKSVLIRGVGPTSRRLA